MLPEKILKSKNNQTCIFELLELKLSKTIKKHIFTPIKTGFFSFQMLVWSIDKQNKINSIR